MTCQGRAAGALAGMIFLGFVLTIIIGANICFVVPSGMFTFEYPGAKGVTNYPCGESVVHVNGSYSYVENDVCSADCTSLYNDNVAIFALTLTAIVLCVASIFRMANAKTKGRLFAFTFVVGGISFIVVFAMGINNYNNLNNACKTNFVALWQFVQATTWISLIPLIFIAAAFVGWIMNMS